MGVFQGTFFGGVSQDGDLLKLKPFTREGLSEQSSQLSGESKSRKVSKNTKKKIVEREAKSG